MPNLRHVVKSVPFVGPAITRIFRLMNRGGDQFRNSTEYWINRYDRGGNSGDGSYNRPADFKAEIVNGIVREFQIDTVIEFGCGDGNQLRLMEYPNYIGYDVSPKAVSICRQKFEGDENKSFKLLDDYAGDVATMSVSMDVIYHLVEDHVFAEYMGRLFDSSNRIVVIYASNTDVNSQEQPPHVKYRKFTDWIDENEPAWRLRDHIPNRYPFLGDTKSGSFADFYIYERTESAAS